MFRFVMDESLIKLPHRFPFRMIDRIIEVIPEKKAMAIKNITGDEPYLQKGFLKTPSIPTILILEAMAQTAGLALYSSSEKEGESLPFLVKVDKFRIKKRAIPGEQLIIEAEVEQIFSNFSKVRVQVKIQKERIARGILVLAKVPLKG